MSQETDDEVMAILCLINHWAELMYQAIDNKYLLAHNGQKEECEKQSSNNG